MKIGIGEFSPAQFDVPQNPIALSGLGGENNGMGYYVDAAFTVPQNPLAINLLPANFATATTNEHGGSDGLGGLECGCGCLGECSCDGGLGCRCHDGSDGLGGISETLSQWGASASSWLSSTIAPVTQNVKENWVMYAAIGGGALLLFAVMSRGGGRSSYRRDLAEAKRRVSAKYPTYAGRARRAVGAF